MRPLKYIATAMFVLVCSVGWTRTVTDTLSFKGGRLILSYDILQRDRQFTISMSMKQPPKLSPADRDKYDVREIIPMFFDRTGTYDIKFDGLMPEAFRVPANLSYEKSEDGYFRLDDDPTIVFSLKSGTTSKISIPVYLVHYKKKGRTIFRMCGDLHIPLNIDKKTSRSAGTELVTQTVTSTSEIEGDNGNITEILNRVKSLKERVDNADRLSSLEDIKNDRDQLRDLSYKIQDVDTRRCIQDVLDAYDGKKNKFEECAKDSESYAQEMEKQERMKAQKEQQAKADSIAAETQKQAEKSLKRTIWMIVGGAILAVVCFVGNQVFQHFRNISNQRSMQEMQERMVKQAESDAKRRAQSYAHNRVHQAKNMARNAARDALKGTKTNKNSKGNGPKSI